MEELINTLNVITDELKRHISLLQEAREEDRDLYLNNILSYATELIHELKLDEGTILRCFRDFGHDFVRAEAELEIEPSTKEEEVITLVVSDESEQEKEDTVDIFTEPITLSQELELIAQEEDEVKADTVMLLPQEDDEVPILAQDAFEPHRFEEEEVKTETQTPMEDTQEETIAPPSNEEKHDEAVELLNEVYRDYGVDEMKLIETDDTETMAEEMVNEDRLSLYDATRKVDATIEAKYEALESADVQEAVVPAEEEVIVPQETITSKPSHKRKRKRKKKKRSQAEKDFNEMVEMVEKGENVVSDELEDEEGEPDEEEVEVAEEHNDNIQETADILSEEVNPVFTNAVYGPAVNQTVVTRVVDIEPKKEEVKQLSRRQEKLAHLIGKVMQKYYPNAKESFNEDKAQLLVESVEKRLNENRVDASTALLIIKDEIEKLL